MRAMRGIATTMMAMALPQTVHAAPPSQLLGKSVTVSWQESRMSRNVGEAAFHNATAAHDLITYVSSEGRVFTRFTGSYRGATGKSEQVAGQGSTRVPRFEGGTMEIFSPYAGGGGMRHIVVTFDSGFGSCSASVTNAGQPGTTVFRGFSLIEKRPVEFHSVSMSGATCSVRAGNVFAQ